MDSLRNVRAVGLLFLLEHFLELDTDDNAFTVACGSEKLRLVWFCYLSCPGSLPLSENIVIIP